MSSAIDITLPTKNTVVNKDRNTVSLISGISFLIFVAIVLIIINHIIKKIKKRSKNKDIMQLNELMIDGDSSFGMYRQNDCEYELQCENPYTSASDTYTSVNDKVRADTTVKDTAMNDATVSQRYRSISLPEEYKNYEIYDVPSDGNCGYHSILQSLWLQSIFKSNRTPAYIKNVNRYGNMQRGKYQNRCRIKYLNSYREERTRIYNNLFKIRSEILILPFMNMKIKYITKNLVDFLKIRFMESIEKGVSYRELSDENRSEMIYYLKICTVYEIYRKYQISKKRCSATTVSDATTENYGDEWGYLNSIFFDYFEGTEMESVIGEMRNGADREEANDRLFSKIARIILNEKQEITNTALAAISAFLGIKIRVVSRLLSRKTGRVECSSYLLSDERLPDDFVVELILISTFYDRRQNGHYQTLILN